MKKIQTQQGIFTKEMNEGYQDMMYINTVFSKEKTLDSLIEDIHPNIKIKQNEKKMLRYLSKVFVEELTQLAIEAKEAMGKKELDKDSVDIAYKKYIKMHPLKKNQGGNLFK